MCGNNENFLLYDSGANDVNRILIFCSDSGRLDLCQAKNIAVDGTFDSCPQIFFQLFTLHVVKKNTSVPRLFALLPNKTENTYERLFMAIKEQVPAFKPESVLLDFEKATMNAINKVYPNASLLGCLFHLGQSHYRKIVDLGLKTEYDSNGEFNRLMKKFTALAFLPPQDVVEAFLELTSQPDVPAEFIQYFELTYIGVERGSRRNVDCL